ncbi:MAG: hypothetical protein JWP81_4098 [Ferruginibacter sp.]|nr:hypothetical protein [Ferruginibacter sp.]
MEESAKRIFSESIAVIGKLQLLSVFFEEEVLYKIFIRTQVIHKLFESNPELDINKLELFHLQYTESILELLRKIKKTNEKNVSVLFDEIQLNKELIAKLTDSMLLEKNFDNEAQLQASKVNESINKLYQNLSGYSPTNPIVKNIRQFGTRYAKDFFHAVSDNFLYGLIEYDPEHVYKNAYATIEKKLLGLQCKHEFNNVFYCGLVSENLSLEVYKLVNEDEYFTYYPAGNLFLDCEFSKLSGFVLRDPLSKKTRLIHELENKNDSLVNSERAVKTNIPPEVKKLLSEYYEKIAAIDFIDFIDDYDVQANILKTMLNTDSM